MTTKVLFIAALLYLSVLVGCVSSRAAGNPCDVIYNQYKEQLAALDDCRGEYKCRLTYTDMVGINHTQSEFYKCFKQYRLILSRENENQ